jgi:protein prenyltransferase alpha subunit repeat containing protein 1
LPDSVLTTCTRLIVRKWIQNHLASCSTYSIDLRQEFQLCQRATTLYPKNYYAWTYRHWLLTLLPNGSDTLQEEYAWCRKWVESNVSDHSGIQHLERCLLRVKKSPLDLIDHTNWLRDNIKRYPGHESLWCHLRFCASLIRPQNQMLLNFETKFVEVILKKCHQSADDAETQMQMQLALRYGLWLSHLVSVNVREQLF